MNSTERPDSMAYGAHGVGLAGAWQSEGQEVDSTLHEAPIDQFAELLSERHRHPVVLEGVPRLSDGQLGRSSESDDAPLPAVLGFLFQHLHESQEGVGVTGCGEPGGCLRSHSGQLELAAQLLDPLFRSVRGDSARAHRTPPTSRPS